MTHRERGAINVVWFIFVIVLFLGALGIVYSQQGQMTRLKDEASSARTAAETAQLNFEEERKQHLALSSHIGFRASNAAVSSQDTLKAKIEELATAYPNAVGASDKSVEAVFQRMRALVE